MLGRLELSSITQVVVGGETFLNWTERVTGIQSKTVHGVHSHQSIGVLSSCCCQERSHRRTFLKIQLCQASIVVVISFYLLAQSIQRLVISSYPKLFQYSLPRESSVSEMWG